MEMIREVASSFVSLSGTVGLIVIDRGVDESTAESQLLIRGMLGVGRRRCVCNRTWEVMTGRRQSNKQGHDLMNGETEQGQRRGTAVAVASSGSAKPS